MALTLDLKWSVHPLIEELSLLPAAPALRLADVRLDLGSAPHPAAGPFFHLAALFLEGLPHVHQRQVMEAMVHRTLWRRSCERQ